LLGVVLLVAVALVGLSVPLPFGNRLAAEWISTQVASEMACAGVSGKPPEIEFSGALLPQLLQRRFDHVEVSMPDLTTGEVKHVAVRATIRDVGQTGDDKIHIGSVDASVSVGFANLPATQDGSPVTYGRAPDGSLAVNSVRKGDPARGTLLAKLELRGNSIVTTPQALKIFGRTVPAKQAAEQIGGPRTQKLPRLPAGMAYKSLKVQKDGLAIGLGGTTTAPLSRLPAKVDGRKVSYRAVNGLLAISPQLDIPLIGNVPMTIFAQPKLARGEIKMDLKSVQVLGSNRSFDTDLIAQGILTQIDQSKLSRKLPALPAGVQYKSVAVSPAGIAVGVGGVTVRPFSQLPRKVDGVTTKYSEDNGLLAATATGGVNPRPTNVTAYIKPRITGNTLDMTPQQIRLFGALVPARDVLAGTNQRNTKQPLQALPAGLAYRGIEVLPNGLRITIGGKNITLNTAQLGSNPAGRTNAAAPRPAACR
jgi:hypothetical protein